ncbi:MAG: hypothetical protein IJY11_03680 [Clostridia bacterium]|nr:hypothetical protein [Clostridia bacterium]
MSQESKKVLSSFTRKLANCRNTVSVKNLVEYFEGGKYGYSIDDGIPTVVTNDFAFADDIANLVTHIRAIFKSPRLFLKKENIIQNVSVATKMDVQSMQATYRDDKNWKVDGGEPHPELVHTFAYEDNYAIYENRFVCALIDAVYDIVSKKVNQLCWNFDTLSGKIKSHKEIPFNSVEFLQFADAQEGIPLLVANDSPEVNVVGSLIKSKKRLQSLRGRELYVQCKKAEKFSLKSVRNTNILTFDADYNFCYNFYLNYLYREPVLATPKQMYFNFVNVNLFRALTLCGYELVEKDATISVSNSIKLRYNEVAFANDLFTITVSPTEEGNLTLKVKANPDFSESTFTVYVVDKGTVTENREFSGINAYARELNENRDESVTRAFLVSDYSPVKETNAFFVEPSYADAVKRLQDLVKSCTMLAEGSFYIHSRICPVCGSNLVAPDGNDYTCALCESTYHIFGYGSKMYLWLKLLPDVKTGEAKTKSGEKAPAKPTNFRIHLRVEQPEKKDEAPVEDAKIDELPFLEETPEELEENVAPAEEPATDVEFPTVEIIEEETAEDVEETVVEEPVEETVEETIEAPVEEAVEVVEEETVEEAPAEEPIQEKAPQRMRVRLHVRQKENAPEAEAVPAPEKDDEAELDIVS